MINHDLVVVGGSLAGLSVAIQAREAGLEMVLVVVPGESVVQPEIVGHHALSVEYQAPVQRLSTVGGDRVLVETPRLVLTSKLVVIAVPAVATSLPPSYELPASLADRLHLGDFPGATPGSDVLVIGEGEEAADTTLRLVGAGLRVVLCLGGADPSTMSRLARRQLLRMEAERRATILWHSQPEAVADVDGYPMVYFGDRRTPDLQFDHIVFCLGPEAPGFETIGIELGPIPDGSLYWLNAGGASPALPEAVIAVSAGDAWEAVRLARFPELPAPSGRPRVWRQDDQDRVALLRQDQYNATITAFERAHSDLWLLRVKPDRGDTTHLAGQYASLGLGYWEPRADGARDRNLEKLWQSLIRRSYSISSPIFDEVGYLFDGSAADEIEFYIVLVPPSAHRIPALTPRLALKRPGDRIYLGPKVAGHYTLHSVTDPGGKVLLLATGTGEAPHNAMIVELLRKGHYGPIVSVVSVRYQDDLAYHDVHRTLEKRFANYRYLPLVTRHPILPKRYVQDALTDGSIAELLGGSFGPDDTHVFACGNPAMIGLPEIGEDGSDEFPATVGVAQLLTERGFTLDRRGVVGTIHYEEYW